MHEKYITARVPIVIAKGQVGPRRQGLLLCVCVRVSVCVGCVSGQHKQNDVIMNDKNDKGQLEQKRFGGGATLIPAVDSCSKIIIIGGPSHPKLRRQIGFSVAFHFGVVEVGSNWVESEGRG